jgi:(heptosyl)LPS beta-1,4-glucosyltransferase
MLIHPALMFFKGYILRLGFLDGPQGLVAALMSSVYEFLKYAKVWELKREKQQSAGPERGGHA